MNGRGTQRLVAGGATVVALVVGNAMAAPAAHAQGMTMKQFFSTKSYPYSGYRGGNSPAGYVKGQCVDYGIWAWEHWTGTRFDHVKVSAFKSIALKKGFKIGTKPRTGALAVWTSHRTHVAYVYSYKNGAATFKVREVRWNTVGPSFRNIGATGIGRHSSKSPKPDYFIYKK